MAQPLPDPPTTTPEREPEPERRKRYIGQPFRRVDGRAKVTGRTLFADDLVFPRMAHMKLVRSTRPHARIRGCDLTRARQVPGVLGFLTGEAMPETFGILPVSQDEHALCPDRVRYVGDPIVAVAATTEDAAHEAALAVEIDYEPLPTISTVAEALALDVPRIHDYGARGNVHKEVSLLFGDVDGGLAEADLVLEDTAFYEGNTHLAMEQHAAVAVPEDDDRLTLYSSTQTPHYVHRALARVLGLPASRIRVIACPNGGGFGGKSDPFNHEIAVAKMALELGRPVKVVLTREEVFYCHRGRHPVLMRIKTGFTQGRHDDRPASRVRPRRRRLRQLRRGLDLLHRRPADGDLQAAQLPLRRRSAASPTSRRAARSAATARRSRDSPSRSISTRRRERLGIDPADLRLRNLAAAGLDHGQLDAARLDRARPLHRSGGRGLGLARAPRPAAARARARARLRRLPVRRRAADLLEPHAPVRGPAAARPLGTESRSSAARPRSARAPTRWWRRSWRRCWGSTSPTSGCASPTPT